ncbi:MAG: winged helix-turn-helix domain-containing protein [Clostridiales bacterium]|nr:winged helix-turn-helix domain-containing protein [Clostridiales bacterium]
MGSDFRVNLYRRALKTDEHGVVVPEPDEPEPGPDGTENETSGPENETNETKSETDPTNARTEKEGGIKQSATEKKLLMAISESPEISQKQLSELTSIPLGAIKRILPELQRKGALKRIGSNWRGK